MVLIEKISGMNITYIRYSFEYFLNSMSQLGIKSIELWGGSPHFYINDLTHSQVRNINKDIKKRDIQIDFFTPEQCMYPINLSAKNNQLRKRSIEYFKKCIDICNTLEVNKMLVTTGLGYFDEDKEEGWKRGRESLVLISNYAREKGVTLALEPLSYYESNVVTDLPTLKRMLDEVQSANLKAMLDTVPMALEGESLEQYFKVFGKDLIHIHFIDTNHLHSHLAWGDGRLPLYKYLETIKKYHYEGNLTLEIIGSNYTNDPHEAMRKSLNSIKNVVNVK